MKSKKTDVIENFEIHMMYDLARAAEILIYDIDRRLRQKNMCFCREKKQLFNKVTSLVEGLMKWYDKLEDDFVVAGVSADRYDLMRVEANELIRLVLLYADRTAKSEENFNKIFDFISSLEGEGLVTDEVLNRFYLKQ